MLIASQKVCENTLDSVAEVILVTNAAICS